MNNEFEDISENIKRIRFNMEEAKVRAGRENDNIKVMAVTKTVSPDRINFAVSQGFELLGENRVQEYLSKKEQYADNSEVHFIGHLQSNKVKYIIDSVTMIQSVDSTGLAKEISARAVKQGCVMDILCEVNIGGEASKSGFVPEAVKEGIYEISELPGVRVCGLMTIPPPSDSCIYFEKMQRLFEDMKASPPKNSAITLLSMGMSADYAEAVKFGTGMVRLGSALFGARNYSV
ncbi:MAG: YggS family pyridoxal phosphate-dependent enzyme [Huintestinicola sp.]